MRHKIRSTTIVLMLMCTYAFKTFFGRLNDKAQIYLLMSTVKQGVLQKIFKYLTCIA